MAFEGDLTNLGIADIIQTLSMNRQTGTLLVKQGETERRFYFCDKGVSVLSSRSSRRFRLGNLLLGLGKLSDGDLRVAVAKQERARESKLGDILMQTGLVKKEDIDEACRYQAAEEIYETFGWTQGKFQFLEGANAGPSGGPGPFAEAFFDAGGMVMEAARRLDESSLIQKKLADMGEFFTKAVEDPAQAAGLGREAAGLFAAIDGKMDLSQLFEEFYLSPYDAGRAFVALLDANLIRIVTPEELVAGAEPLLEKKEFPGAARMLARAVHHRPEDTALLEALSKAQLGAGDRKAAARTLVRLGRTEHAASRNVEAVEALRRAAEQDVGSVEAHEALMEVHAALQEMDKAESACRDAARLLTDDRSFDEAIALVERGLEILPESVGLRVARANAFLGKGRRDDGVAELLAVSKQLEERKDFGPLTLSVYQKLHLLQPDNKEFKEKVDFLLAGEKARARRKQALRASTVLAVLAVLAAGWYLKPRTATQRLELAEAILRDKSGLDAARIDEAEQNARAAKESAGSDEAFLQRAESALAEVRDVREGPARQKAIRDLQEELRTRFLEPAIALAREGRFLEATAKALEGPLPVKVEGSGPTRVEGPWKARLPEGKGGGEVVAWYREQVRGLAKTCAEAVRDAARGIARAQTAIEGIDIDKAQEELHLKVEKEANEAIALRKRADWKAVVEAVAAAVLRAGDLEGFRPDELRRSVEEMDKAMIYVEDKGQAARALLEKQRITDLFRSTTRGIQMGCAEGNLDKAIADADAFLARCEALRQEKPEQYFQPVAESLFTRNKFDERMRAEREKLVKARKGLETAQAIERAGDLARAFETYRAVIQDAPEINFATLVRLPLRVETRPPGARLTVILPDQSRVDAGTTPKVIHYPHQGKTVLRVEMEGFDTHTVERAGIEGDRGAQVTLDLQRTVRWKREAGAAVEGRPALGEGLLLLATRGGLFRAWETRGGDESFQLETGHLSGVSGGIVVSGGVAYFGGNDGEAFAVDLAKRAFLWRKKTTAALSSDPVIADGRVVFVDAKGKVVAFDARTGEERWKVTLASPATGTLLAARGGLVLVGAGDRRLRALEAADGKERWTAELSGPVSCTPEEDGTGGVVVGTEDKNVQRVDLATGKVTWTAPVDSPVRAQPLPGKDVLRVVSSGGFVHRLAPADGKPLGKTSLGLPAGVEGGVAATNERLYVSGSAGTLVAYDLRTDSILWRLSGLGTLRSPPLVAPGLLAVASADGTGRVIVVEP